MTKSAAKTFGRFEAQCRRSCCGHHDNDVLVFIKNRFQFSNLVMQKTSTET